MVEIALLSFFAVLTSVISAIVGMAGGITLLSFMTFFMSWNAIIPVHGMVQLVSNGSRTLLLRKKAKKKVIVPFMIGLPFGVCLAVYLVKSLPNKDIPLLLVSALIFYVLFKPKKLPALVIPLWAFSILGIVTGFLSILIGATGPLLAPFFLRKDLDKEEIIGTKAACQFGTHIFKIPSFLYLGFDYLEYGPLIIAMSLAAVLGTYLGVKILGKVTETLFRRIYQVALFLAACRLIYKVYFG